MPTKVHLVKAMFFPVVTYGCESWTVKKAEHRRIDAFELWCWRRLLRVPWTAKRSNQSILKNINPEYSLEGLMLKLKLQYFGHLIRSWLTWKDPDAGRDWRKEEKGTTEDEMAGWHHRLNGREFAWTPRVGDGELLMGREALHAAIRGVAKTWTRLSDWTELNWRLGLEEFQGLQRNVGATTRTFRSQSVVEICHLEEKWKQDTEVRKCQLVPEVAFVYHL